MSWLDDIQKDLQDARQHPSREKKDWEIERDIRLRGMSKMANDKSQLVDPTNRILHAKKIGKKNKGRTMSSEAKKKISESTKGKVVTEETRKKMSNAHKGKPKSESHKQKLSEARMGIKCEHTSKRNSEMNSKRFKCEHCGRDIGGWANYKRFHGDECKKNPKKK